MRPCPPWRASGSGIGNLRVMVGKVFLNTKINATFLTMKNKRKKPLFFIKLASGVFLVTAVLVIVVVYAGNRVQFNKFSEMAAEPPPKPKPKLDTLAYDLKMYEIAHVATSSLIISPSAGHVWFATTTAGTASSTPRHIKVPLWPVRATYPNYGALLPFNRIVAFYGNFYSTQMGILGEFPEAEVLAKLQAQAAAWFAADPDTPVIPAIEYIAVTAQASSHGGTYRSRMPDSEIQKAVDMAAKIKGIVILDVQDGKSTLADELPPLGPFLKLPQVHLAIDPEFSMKDGRRPGTVIGTMDAGDVNYAANFLAGIVKANDIPPKILIVHRFTDAMVTGYKDIKPLPEVQIVMDMDGWGPPSLKIKTYREEIYNEPVQFAGFKLFYKNDLRGPYGRLMTPSEVLKLTPAPSFIMYQ